MRTAHFSFLPGLDYFLPLKKRNTTVVLNFRGQQSVKHLIESLGVPHPEVGEILVNGHKKDLTYITQDGDRVEVHPIPNGYPLDPRFLLDSHLGRLTAYLRMLGFDCLYQNDYEDDELAELVQEDARILLTRDRRLLMRKVVIYGYCLRSLDSQIQLVEVVHRFDLAGKINPFHRCLRCNHLLELVNKEAILDRLEPLTRLYFNEFRLCPACDQVYWQGSHYARMQALIERVNQ